MDLGACDEVGPTQLAQVPLPAVTLVSSARKKPASVEILPLKTQHIAPSLWCERIKERVSESPCCGCVYGVLYTWSMQSCGVMLRGGPYTYLKHVWMLSCGRVFSLSFLDVRTQSLSLC